MGKWSWRRALGLLVAVNLLLGVALFGLRSPIRAAVQETGPRPELPAQVQRVQEQIAQGLHGQPYRLDLSDEDLTALVGYYLAGHPDIPFARVRVAVSNGRVVGDAVTKGLAVTVPVRVTATAEARNGTPRVRVEDVSLGETQVPGFLRDQVVRQVNASLDPSRYDLAIIVDSIQLAPGAMTISGVVK